MLTAFSPSLIFDGGGSQLHETSVLKRSDPTPVTSSVHPTQDRGQLSLAGGVGDMVKDWDFHIHADFTVQSRADLYQG